jgi:hypothetical protein
MFYCFVCLILQLQYPEDTAYAGVLSPRASCPAKFLPNTDYFFYLLTNSHDVNSGRRRLILTG